MPKPPADRKHGTGDRNIERVAEIDNHLQDRHDERSHEEVEQAERRDQRQSDIGPPQ